MEGAAVVAGHLPGEIVGVNRSVGAGLPGKILHGMVHPALLSPGQGLGIGAYGLTHDMFMRRHRRVKARSLFCELHETFFLKHAGPVSRARILFEDEGKTVFSHFPYNIGKGFQSHEHCHGIEQGQGVFVPQRTLGGFLLPNMGLNVGLQGFWIRDKAAIFRTRQGTEDGFHSPEGWLLFPGSQ